MAKGTKEIVNVAFQETQLCLWREETVEVSLYLARKHQTQTQIVHVAYRNVPLVCMCMWLDTYKSKATINKKIKFIRAAFSLV